jgi:phage terminase small subunit
MSQSAEASAEPPFHARTPAQPLPHRQEAFARHVASGRSLTEAARLAGYAWDSARQTGSRLMKEPHIAARAAHLAQAREDQRQGELDDLVAALKRLMTDCMGRQNDFAALRAIDMIARLRGLAPVKAKRSRGLDTALEEMRLQATEAVPEADDAEEEAGQGTEQGTAAPLHVSAPDAEADTVFDPPMPPELPPPVEALPATEPAPTPLTVRALQRAAALEANRAAVKRRIFCCEHLLTLHPELSGRIDDPSDALAYFDENDSLLPKELWPSETNPASIAASGEMPQWRGAKAV